MEIEEQFFEVGDKVKIMNTEWHLKEFPVEATISQVMHAGWLYRCSVEGFEWELGPFCASQLKAKTSVKKRKTTTGVKKRKRRPGKLF